MTKENDFVNREINVANLPCLAIMKPVIISGVQPPIAKTVIPMTDSGMENV